MIISTETSELINRLCHFLPDFKISIAGADEFIPALELTATCTANGRHLVSRQMLPMHSVNSLDERLSSHVIRSMAHSFLDTVMGGLPMTATPIIYYKCPGCGTILASPFEAAACCFEGALQGYCCDACGEIHESKEDAERCCQ